MSDFIIDKYVSVKPGEYYRWLPFGTITKGGRKIVVDEQFAAALKLPHFHPPIMLGSHDDPTPAGGHIVAFETRADGIYVKPEYNPAGERALAEGHYRYHSPEILARGAMELPDGTRLEAPIILGDALLHTPHLGAQAALYTAEVNEEIHMSENVTFPASLFERLLSRFAPAAPAPETEDYGAQIAAAKAEADRLVAEAEAKAAALAAKLAEREQAEALTARVARFTGELAAVKVDTALAPLLAALPDETTEPMLAAFKALAAQINEAALLAARGTQPAPGVADDPRAAFDAAVKAKAAEKNITYNAAVELVRSEQPELFAAVFGA